MNCTIAWIREDYMFSFLDLEGLHACVDNAKSMLDVYNALCLFLAKWTIMGRKYFICNKERYQRYTCWIDSDGRVIYINEFVITGSVGEYTNVCQIVKVI